MGTLTLTGFTGAGARSVNAPVFFQDFTTTTTGQSAASLGYGRGAGQPVVVDMTEGLDARSGSLKWETGAGSDVGGGIAEAFPHVYNLLPPGSLQVIRAVSMKLVKTRSTSGQTGPMQLKSFRAGTTSPSDSTPFYSGQPAFKTSLYINASHGDFTSVFSTWESLGNTVDHTLWSAATPTWHVGGWNHFKVIFSHNTLGSADGRITYWINGVCVLDRRDCAPRTAADQALQYIQLLPGFDFKVGDEWTVRYANDYIDNQLSRVELTDNATYSNSTRWALQPVLAWSDSTITVRLNAIGFIAGTRGYFHIFNARGDHVGVIERSL
jgi:hypothetical protein